MKMKYFTLLLFCNRIELVCLEWENSVEFIQKERKKDYVKGSKQRRI